MTALLQPVIALAAWTLAMCLWMYATRLPAMTKAKVDPDSLARDPDMSLEKVLAPDVQWKAHNFNHLHEAPTVFYAVTLALALMAAQAGTAMTEAVWFAWAYVALRIAHSLVQATVNKVLVRFILFSLSQIALLGLIMMAAMRIFGVN